MFPIYPIILILAIVLAFFLFWRACRHELVDSQAAFDLAVVGAIGALIFSRVGEFLVNYSQFNWSISRLVFFNVYPGFDFYGALAGLFIVVGLLARVKKLNVLTTLDLLVAPLVFAQGVISLGKYFSAESVFAIVWLFYALGFLVIFWVLKRLAKRKRHDGFFICFYLISYSILEIILFWWRGDVLFIKNIPYQLVAPLVIFQGTLIIWYVTSGRNFMRDLKDFFAHFLLSIFRFRRMIRDVNEAGEFSRSIILVPYWLARETLKLLKWVVWEIIAGFVDLLHVLGVRR